MLNLVEVRTDQGLMLALPLHDTSDGYLVKDIDGLDPVDAVLTYSSMANQDDELEGAAKRVKRNVVIKLGYMPDYATGSVKQLRDRLYSFFMPKTQVSLRFYSDDMPTVEIKGRVEKMNAPLFARDPEATISIICPKSDFVGSPFTVEGFTTSGSEEVEVIYAGSIPTGGILRVNPTRDIDTFTTYNRISDFTTLSQEFTFPLVSGDLLEISSVPLQKGAKLTRNGNISSILRGVSPSGTWLNLYPGVNKLRLTALGNGIPWSFQYANKYGGL